MKKNSDEINFSMRRKNRRHIKITPLKIYAASVTIALAAVTAHGCTLTNAFAQDPITITESPTGQIPKVTVLETPTIEEETEHLRLLTAPEPPEWNEADIYQESDFMELMTPYKTVAEAMTEEEKRLLEIILACEAQGGPEEELRGVVEVIFNRVLSEDPYWPDTVYDVLAQKGQFATWKYRNNPYNTPGDAERDAIAAVIAEGPTVLPEDYVFFSKGKHSWMHDPTKIGRQWFGR